MKIKKFIKVFLIVLLFLVLPINIIADVSDFNGGETVTVTGSGKGNWIHSYVGLKIGIVSSEGELEDVEIVLESGGLPSSLNVSDNNRSKMFQSTSIKWVSRSTSNYVRSSYVPGEWGYYTFIDLHKHLSNPNNLSEPDYANLLGILNLTKDGSKLFDTLGSGDYIVVEPMTYIDGYFGTAFELGNSFFSDSSNCWTEGKFCYKYGKRIFGGSSNNTSGGVLYTTIYLSEDLTIGNLSLSKFTTGDFSNEERRKRNSCLKSTTCGRGMGIYKYDDIVPPSEPEEEKYTLDLNYCVDGVIDYHLPRIPANFSYDFKVNNRPKVDTYFYKNLPMDTTYSISNIVVNTSDFTYMGYNVGSYGQCGIDSTENSISGTITGDTSVNLIFESSCQKKLESLRNADGSYDIQDLFDLYKYYFDKPAPEKKDYRGLLNLASPSCTTGSSSDNELEKLACLTASKSTDLVFNEENLSNYDGDPLKDSSGKYVGFCLTSMDLTNNLNTSKFYSKAGQFLVKEFDNSIYYNTLTGEKTVSGTAISTAKIEKKCYVLKSERPEQQDFYKTDETVSVYFGDNDGDLQADLLERSVGYIKQNIAVATLRADLVKYSYERTFNYRLNELWLNRIDGTIVDENAENAIYARGVISKFTSSSGEIPFKINYGIDYTPTNAVDKCTFDATPQVVVDNKLNIEFRSIDTNQPFNRNTMTNWSDGADNSKDNKVVKEIIKNRNDSYNRTGEGAMYTNDTTTGKVRILLTPDIILEIRKYNAENAYDDYKVICDANGENCKSAFLQQFGITKVR